jgi:hypothetical protein
MRFRQATAACAALVCLGLPSTAAASPVLVMDHDGRVHARNDRFLRAADELTQVGDARDRRGRSARRAAKAATGATPSALRALLDSGAIDQATYDEAADVYARARRLLGKVTGFRRVQMGAVLANQERMAAAGRLTASRLPALMQTLARNVEWWSNGPLLSPGRRVSFAGSRIVWQHYANQGLQIQWLATWGKANALFKDKLHDTEFRAALDEALALAGQRAGGVAFEYLFPFDGGSPPWVSGLAQGTALTALSRGAIRLADNSYFLAARSALGIFRTPPPEGVAQPNATGTHYLQYSFTGQHILNGFVQALNGLHDFAVYANDDEGRALFAAGEQELRAELPAYDTGGWSRYSPGKDSPLSYHELLLDFLHSLCIRMRHSGEDGEGYCAASDRFAAYLTTPPVVTLSPASTTARKKRLTAVRFGIDKPGTVTVVLKRSGFFKRLAARVSSGPHSFPWRPPRAGTYTVRVDAVDLKGNKASIDGTAEIRP